MPNPGLSPQLWIKIRYSMVFLTLVIFVLAARRFPLVTGCLVFVCFGIAALLSTQDWLKKVRWPSSRTQIRWIRYMRRAIHPPPFAMVAYSSFVAIATFSIVMALGFSKPLIWKIGVAIAIVALSVAATVDVGYRLRAAWRLRATRIAIKWLGLFVATVTIFGATVFGKDLAHSVSQINPEHLPDFVRLATVLVYPFVLVTVIAGLLLFLLTIQYVLLLFGMLAIFPGRMLFDTVIGEKREALNLLLYRLWTGHRPLKSPRWWLKALDGTQYFLRPAGTAALSILLLSAITEFAALTAPLMNKFLPDALVLIEYRARSSCEGLPANARVAYLDDGLISVAERNSSGYAFSIRKCELSLKNS